MGIHNCGFFLTFLILKETSKIIRLNYGLSKIKYDVVFKSKPLKLVGRKFKIKFDDVYKQTLKTC